MVRDHVAISSCVKLQEKYLYAFIAAYIQKLSPGSNVSKYFH